MEDPSTNPTILREYLGGCETINLSTPEGYEAFVKDVVQDYEVADELIERIKSQRVVTVNEDQPEYIERYTVVVRGLDAIINRKSAGIDNTEDESAVILRYLDTCQGEPPDEIAHLFPLELAQWHDEHEAGAR